MAKSKFYKILQFFLLCIFSLYGCSNRSNIVQMPSHSKATNLLYWQAKGKIAGYDDQNNWRGSIVWKQLEKQYSIHLLPSLSSQKFNLSQSKSGATLSTAKKQYTGDDLDSLLLTHLNWQVPVSSLQYWLRGLPDPKFKYTISSNKKIMYQNGWAIEYKEYFTNYKYILPKKIFLSKKPFSLRIIINNWKI